MDVFMYPEIVIDFHRMPNRHRTEMVVKKIHTPGQLSRFRVTIGLSMNEMKTKNDGTDYDLIFSWRSPSRKIIYLTVL